MVFFQFLKEVTQGRVPGLQLFYFINHNGQWIIFSLICLSVGGIIILWLKNHNFYQFISSYS
jgi:hypothetical protein